MNLSILLTLLLAGGVQLPDTEDFVLANGMRVLLVANREVPLVSFEVRYSAGAVRDPAGKEGTASLLAALLTKGAGERDANAFQEAIDQVGGRFSAGASRRWTTVRGEFLKENTDLALDLLADVLRRPALDGEELKKERGLAIDGVRAARQSPADLIATYWNGWLFKGHPYARPPSGDEQTLARITLADIKRAQASLGPDNVWMAVAGDFDPVRMRGEIEKRFADWPRLGPRLPPDRAKPPAPEGNRVLLVDKPDALQTYFRFGDLAFDWSDPDYPARYLANTILGGRFTSRLNTALRIKAGLTYGARSRFDDDLGGAFHVHTFTQTKTSKEALALALEVYGKFVVEGITQAELDSARSYVKGQYAPRTIETADQIASMILRLESDGLSRDIVNRFFQNLDALTLREVNRVITKRFPEKDLSWVVIGRGDVLAPIIGAYGTVTRVSIKGPGFAPR